MGRLFLLFALLISVPGYAADQCYSPAELQAEQLLRLHSELMVISVTCHQASDGQDLISSYTGFTRAHIKALHHAEQIMETYYKSLYGGNGISQLDQLRTRLANEYGQKIADLSAPVFCQLNRDRALQMCSVNSGQLTETVQQRMTSEHAYGAVCTRPSSPLAKTAP